MPSESTIKRNLLRAKGVSECSDFPRQKIGCILVQGNRVLAVGYNCTKTNPMQKRYNRYRNFEEDSANNGSIHAEMQILIKTKYWNVDWNNTVLYIYREFKRNHKPALAKPCLACSYALWGRGITEVYYTDHTNSKGYSKLSWDFINNEKTEERPEFQSNFIVNF